MPIVQQPATQPRGLASLAAPDAPQPDRLLVHGEAGVGKSTFAAQAPKAVLLPLEKVGSHVQRDVRDRGGLVLRQVATLQALHEALEQVAAEGAAYSALILDGINFAERWIWDLLVTAEPPSKSGRKATSIEEVGGGYGKGYTAAIDHWRQILWRLEQVQERAGLRVILVGHTDRRKVKNAVGDDYEVMALAVHPSAGELIQRWTDSTLYAEWEKVIGQSASDERGKLFATRNRIVHCQANGAWQAKDRHGRPPVLPLDWAAVEPYQEITRLLALLGPRLDADAVQRCREGRASAADAKAVLQIRDWLAAQAGAKEQK